jgi:hypothetical protein
VLIGEAWRSVAARPIRFVVLSLLAGLILASATALEAGANQQVVSAQAEAAQAGVGVLVIDNEGGTFDGAGCATLARIQGVAAAGALYEVRASHATLVPSALFQLATVSPGLIHVLDPRFRQASAGSDVLGNDMRSVLGLAVGSRLAVPGDVPGEVGGVMSDRMRATERGRWVFRVSVRPTDAKIRECWAQVSSNAADGFTQLVPALFPDVDKLRIRRLSSPTSLQALIVRFDERPTRFAWLAAGGIIGVIALFVPIFRRSEYALYAVSGFRLVELDAIAFAEQCASVLLAAIFGASAGFLAFSLQYQSSAAALRAGGLTLAMSVSLAVGICAVGSLWAGSIDVARSLKNRD